MEAHKVERINELARESKVRKLTPDELAEQKALREEYIADYRRNLEGQLGNIRLVDENGEQTELKKK